MPTMRVMIKPPPLFLQFSGFSGNLVGGKKRGRVVAQLADQKLGARTRLTYESSDALSTMH
jgi:hypothetical protein